MLASVGWVLWRLKSHTNLSVTDFITYWGAPCRRAISADQSQCLPPSRA